MLIWLPGKARSIAASRAAASPISRMVCSAAATSAPSAPRTRVRVPIWLPRAGAAASVRM
ncbi:MAG TPA: hypothetical protein VGA04_24605 [Streptosporangiaceae bacterium]